MASSEIERPNTTSSVRAPAVSLSSQSEFGESDARVIALPAFDRNTSIRRALEETMFDDIEMTRAVIRFGLPAAIGATTASVVGDFNDWDASANLMVRATDGSFESVIEVAVGRTYQYRFLVDGERWENDWNADSYAPNVFGGDDSVLDLANGSSRLTRAATAGVDTVVPGTPEQIEQAPINKNSAPEGSTAVTK